MDRLPAVASLAPEELVRGFVPTRRFGRVSFDSYTPDPRYPSQARALERMRAFAAGVGAPGKGKQGWRLFASKPPAARRAVYLDGGYGVGKTHLLAATYHAVPDRPRLYLTFADLAYAITRLGMQATLEAFTRAQLVCIDEFELDDVAQTRMASMFLTRLLKHRSVHVVTTSNTLPSDLGQGRFAADAFQRDIGEIASAFEVVSIDGEDYRHRHWDELARPRLLTSHELTARAAADPENTALLIRWQELQRELERVHPVHYGQIASQLQALYVQGLHTIDDQAVALRLVHFIDKLYEEEVRLSLTSQVPLTDIFSSRYRQGGYEKKYRRCLSRIHELVAETEHALAEKVSEGVTTSQVQLG